jgi:hypothetical protein
MMIPNGVTLLDWSASLIIDFPTDNVPALTNEEYWKEWGDEVVGLNSFSINEAPNTQGYSDWKSWANDVFLTMCNF